MESSIVEGPHVEEVSVVDCQEEEGKKDKKGRLGNGALDLSLLSKAERNKLKKMRKQMTTKSGSGKTWTIQDYVDIFGYNATAGLKFNLDTYFKPGKRESLIEWNIQELILWTMKVHLTAPRWFSLNRAVLVNNVVVVAIDGLNMETFVRHHKYLSSLHAIFHPSAISKKALATHVGQGERSREIILRPSTEDLKKYAFPLNLTTNSVYDRYSVIKGLLNCSKKHLKSSQTKALGDGSGSKRKAQGGDAGERVAVQSKCKRTKVDQDDGKSSSSSSCIPSGTSSKARDSSSGSADGAQRHGDVGSSLGCSSGAIELPGPEFYLLSKEERLNNGYPVRERVEYSKFVALPSGSSEASATVTRHQQHKTQTHTRPRTCTHTLCLEFTPVVIHCISCPPKLKHMHIARL